MVQRVLVVRGAFAPKDQMARLAIDVPDARFDFCDLSTAAGYSVASYVTQLERFLSTQPPSVVVGVSLGGVIALGLRSPKVVGVLALDPPVRTADCEPLWAGYRPLLDTAPEFLWSVFGLAKDRTEPRDYLSLAMDQRAPTIVLAGSREPLPDGRLPGLISDPTLKALGQMARTERLPGVGHDIGLGGSPRILASLLSLLQGGKDEQDRAVRTG